MKIHVNLNSCVTYFFLIRDFKKLLIRERAKIFIETGVHLGLADLCEKISQVLDSYKTYSILCLLRM